MPSGIKRQVIGTLRTPAGEPFVNKTLAWFRARREVSPAGSTTVVDQPIYCTTDESGQIDFELYSGNYTIRVKLEDVDRYFNVPIPDEVGPINIVDVLDAAPIDDGVLTQVQQLVVEARAWAENPQDVEVDPVDYPDEYSSRHHAAKASASAIAAAASAAAIAPYPDRATAEAANTPGSLSRIAVASPSWYDLPYKETVALDRMVALVNTGGTRFWRPTDFVSVQHFAENTVPGVTDMSDAIDTMLAGLSYYPLVGKVYPDYAGLHQGSKFAAPQLVTFMGEHVAISRPIIAGALDTDLDETFDVGSGALYGLQFDHGRLVALDTFDASPLATHNHPTEGVVTTIPGFMVVLGTYETTDRRVLLGNRFYVNDIKFGDLLEIDCNFKTGGIYLTNTNRTEIGTSHLFNIGKNQQGIRTSASGQAVSPNHIGNFNPCSGAPFDPSGSQNKNPELRIQKVMISGRDRQSQTTFPEGEDEDSMNTTAIMVHSADFHIDAPIITAVTTSMQFDMFSNGQLYNAHPWAKQIIYGPDLENMFTSGVYLDFTDVVLYSFQHQFVNCAWMAGSPNMRLIATTANEDADGLVISGCRFINTSTMVYETEAAGSWVDDYALKHTISGVYSETGDLPLMQLGEHVRVDANGSMVFSDDGKPAGFITATSNGDFSLVPIDAAGTEEFFNKLRYDRARGAWHFGQDAPNSNGNGFILRSPNGTKYLVTVDNAGVLTTTGV